MTGKEIIINDINVTGCEHRYAKECMTVWASGGSHALHKVLCYNSPNCYFKQLKRKEQECEEMNLANEKLVDEKYKLNLLINRYQLALDEIEKLSKENVELLEGFHLEQANCLIILGIINEAKDGE